jgi:hypothetical protein
MHGELQSYEADDSEDVDGWSVEVEPVWVNQSGHLPHPHLGLIGSSSSAHGNTATAFAPYEQATDLVPGESRYWRKGGRLHNALRCPEQALKCCGRRCRPTFR